jgi:hypothetical protein
MSGFTDAEPEPELACKILLAKYSQAKEPNAQEQKVIDRWLDSMVNERFIEILTKMDSATYQQIANIKHDTLNKHMGYVDVIRAPRSKLINALELIRAMHRKISRLAYTGEINGDGKNNPAGAVVGDLIPDRKSIDELKLEREEVELEIAKKKLVKAEHDIAMNRREYINREEFAKKMQWLTGKLKTLNVSLRKHHGPLAAKKLLDCCASIEEDLKAASEPGELVEA